MLEDYINIEGRQQGSFSAGAQSPLLPAGVYDIWATADIHIKVDQTNAADVSSATGYLVRSGTTKSVKLAKPSFIGAAGTATVYYHQIG